MKIKVNRKLILILLIIFINIILRIPSFPHEMGIDSFEINGLANSISQFGVAKWIIHPLSTFGFYPYSYASAVMFILSGINQSTGIDMEKTVWIYCLIIGLLSAFVMYMMAGSIINDDIFKAMVALIFSVSPGVLILTTWDSSSRGLFIILIPVLFYLLIKIYQESRIRFSILLIVFLLFLTATHHFIFLTIPIMFAFLLTILFFKYKDRIGISDNLINVAYVVAVPIVFFISSIGRIFMDKNWERIDWLDIVIVANIRYSGILLFLAFAGLFYLSFKNKKNFGEWFFLLSLLIFIPFMNIKEYAHYFFLVFSSFLIGISLINIVKSYKDLKKYSIYVFIIFILFSVFFSSFYQHGRSHSATYGTAAMDEWYMPQSTYDSGLWIKERIDKNLVANSMITAKRTFAISEVPTYIGYSGLTEFVSGFIELNETDIIKNSPISTKFYSSGALNPYVLNYTNMEARGERSPRDYLNYFLLNRNVNDGTAKDTISRLNLSYMIEDKQQADGELLKSLRLSRNNVYNNGQILIWSLE